MEPAAILEQLIASEDLPKEALRAASDRRADMAPLFVERIENYVAAGSAELESRALFLIFHLLGEWRETSAYRCLARLLRCPREQINAALGDSTTETSHRVMAAVYDGDPHPIYDIILDANADEFVRARMCDALALLALQGRLDRAEAASFLRDCWMSLQPRNDCYVWCGWESAIAMLGLTELKSVVKEAYDPVSSTRAGSPTVSSKPISSTPSRTRPNRGANGTANSPCSATPSKNFPLGIAFRSSTGRSAKGRAMCRPRRSFRCLQTNRSAIRCAALAAMIPAPAAAARNTRSAACTALEQFPI